MADDVTRAEFESAINQLTTGLNEMKASVAQLHTRISDESKIRSLAIEDVNARLDRKLEGIDDKLDTLAVSLANLTGTIQSWGRVNESVRDEVERLHQQARIERDHIDEITGMIGKHREHHNRLVDQVNGIYRTIHGDQSADGPDSLFKIISAVRDGVANGNSRLSQQIQALSGVVGDNQRSIRELQEAQRRRERRARIVTQSAMSLISDPRGIMLLLAALLTVLLTLYPELSNVFGTIIEVIQ